MSSLRASRHMFAYEPSIRSTELLSKYQRSGAVASRVYKSSEEAAKRRIVRWLFLRFATTVKLNSTVWTCDLHARDYKTLFAWLFFIVRKSNCKNQKNQTFRLVPGFPTLRNRLLMVSCVLHVMQMHGEITCHTGCVVCYFSATLLISETLQDMCRLLNVAVSVQSRRHGKALVG